MPDLECFMLVDFHGIVLTHAHALPAINNHYQREKSPTCIYDHEYAFGETKSTYSQICFGQKDPAVYSVERHSKDEKLMKSGFRREKTSWNKHGIILVYQQPKYKTILVVDKTSSIGFVTGAFLNWARHCSGLCFT